MVAVARLHWLGKCSFSVIAVKDVAVKIVLVGASGTLGQKISGALSGAGHEIVKIGRKSGDVQADFAGPDGLAEIYKTLEPFDAVAIAAGAVAFGAFPEITREQWQFSFNNKLLAQISAVQQALPYINDDGSFTLVGGLMSEEPIPMGAAASTVNRALEGFVVAAAIELPRGLRINLISPSLIEESLPQFGDLAPGVIPVSAARVAQAYKRSILGAHTGQIYKIRG
jgi:NAD(P)-dependent dehydrogenase (short-subunit alcohol dehydrogenase family)